jgi:hypothetical protein
LKARYALSSDTSFQQVGESTGIDYHADFACYKKMLCDNRKKRPIRELFKEWDDYIFAGVRSISSNNDLEMQDISMASDAEALAALEDEGSESECGE